jgi:hypothetical protein
MVMDSREDDLSNQYKALQTIVDQSAVHTNRQLSLINGSTYIGGFILLAFTLGIIYFLNVFEYWVLTSFILFYFLLPTAIFSFIRSFHGKDEKETLKFYQEKHKEITNRVESCLQKNLSVLMQSLAIIFMVSFFILLSIQYNWIIIPTTFDISIPAVTCLLFLPVPFFIKEFTQLLKPAEIKKSLQRIIQQNQQTLWKVPLTWNFVKPFIFSFYLAVLFIMPALSIWMLRTLIAQWPYLFLIVIMQSCMIILFSNSFSANTVRKELSNTITTYADINFLLSMAEINEHYTFAEYQHLYSLYQTAKPFDFSIKDTFKFINYYMLVPNRYYLKEILKQTIKNTSTTTPESKKQEPEPAPSYVPPAVKKTPLPSPNFIKPAYTQMSSQKMRTETHYPPPAKPASSEDLSDIMDKRIADIKLGKVGILLYGPMLDEVSKEIKSSLKNHISNIRTPFKVELARKNDELGGAPELVPVGSGGTHVNGDLLILKDTVTETQARDMLTRMEEEFEIKALSDFYGVEKVFYPSVKRNINQITPEKLAKLTIDSVINTDAKDPDGFTYLMELRKHNIKTPMSEAIEEEILNQTASNSLLESRRKLEQVKKIKSSLE